MLPAGVISEACGNMSVTCVAVVFTTEDMIVSDVFDRSRLLSSCCVVSRIVIWLV